MAITLSKKSLNRLKLPLVHSDIARVVVRAAEICDQPFEVFEGRRTLATQKKYVKNGVSKTLNSRHLVGLAVDLVPLIAGKLMWAAPACIKISQAMEQAAIELGIAIRWGGDWDRDGDWQDERFFDGPHFELEKSTYPNSTDPRIKAGLKPVRMPSKNAEAAARSVLVIGDTGEGVKRLQNALVILGWPVSKTGIFDPHTYRAVVAFQTSAGLEPDGEVGPVTRNKITEDLKYIDRRKSL